MNLSERAVIVKELPQNCEGSEGKKFLYDLAHIMAETVRPAVVLDCTRTLRLDKPALLLMLYCLEEAMKRNGDVRIAGLHPDAWSALKSAGVGHLFRNFATTAEAVGSYRGETLDQSLSIASPDEAQANAA